MKKIFLIAAFFVFIMCSISVFAQEEIVYEIIEPTKYAETYIDNDVRLSMGGNIGFFSSDKTIGQTLSDGWSELADEISVYEYNINIDDIGEIYRGNVYNNPRLYYVSTGFSISYIKSNGTVVSVFPVYTETDKDVISKTLTAIDDATEEIMMYLDESMTDFEKIMTVHDYMVLHYEYDYTYSNYDITIMTTKTGVCMSYALAFKHLMDNLGIECLYVASQEEMDHAWNIVKLDSNWYHIDLTWDDPGTNYGQVSHKFALLSDKEIQSLDDPHYGYDLKGLKAESEKYDKVHWHDGIGAVVTINKIYYYVDGNRLIDQNGKIIFDNLDGGDGFWSVGGGYGFSGGNYTGIAEYNGILYFNSDEAVYSYNPETGKIAQVLKYDGICGMLIDRNTLEYCKLDIETMEFVIAGKYNLGKIRFGGTFHNNHKIVKRIYKEKGTDDIFVYACCEDCVKLKKISASGVTKISFDEKECQTLFYWNSNLEPLKQKEVYK